jgi:RNA polymerase sigma factor (sigma-70 family)
MIDNTGLDRVNTAVKLWIETKDDVYFTIIYDAYRNLLINYVKRIVHNDDVAKDIIQDTFVSVIKNIYQYDPVRGKFSTWIYNIAKNAAFAHLNLEKKQDVIRENGSKFLYTVSGTQTSDKSQEEDTTERYIDNPNPIEPKGNEDMFKIVMQLTIQEILNLNDKYRDYLYDREIRGLSYDEIAIRYDAKLNTVKSKIRIGREIIASKVIEHLSQSGIDIETLPPIIKNSKWQ